MEVVKHVSKIHQVYLLNKYIKYGLWSVAVGPFSVQGTRWLKVNAYQNLTVTLSWLTAFCNL